MSSSVARPSHEGRRPPGPGARRRQQAGLLRLVLVLSVAMLIETVVGRATAADAPGARTNVILIVADDLGRGDVGCSGNSDLDTPARYRRRRSSTISASIPARRATWPRIIPTS